MNERPVLIHTHGIGTIDYSSMSPEQLGAVHELAVEGGSTSSREFSWGATIFLRWRK